MPPAMAAPSAPLEICWMLLAAHDWATVTSAATAPGAATTNVMASATRSPVAPKASHARLRTFRWRLVLM